MNFLKFCLFSILLYFITHVNGSYIIPSELIGDIDNRAGAATFSRGNTVYTYGGATYKEEFSNIFSSISLVNDEGKQNMLYEIVYQQTPGPLCARSTTVYLPESDSVLLFIGRYPDNQKNDTLKVFKYKFNEPGRFWDEIILANNSVIPSTRRDYTATLATNGKIYLYGGIEYATNDKLNQLLVFDPLTNQLSDITKSHQSTLNSHTATALPNGLIVFVTGSTSVSTRSILSALPSEEAIVYDTINDAFTIQKIGGISFPGRTSSSAILAPDQKTIVLFGGLQGYDMAKESVCNDLLFLDTSTWTWSASPSRGFPPAPRNQASIGYLNSNNLVIAYGQSITTLRNDINILQFNGQSMTTLTWLREFQAITSSQLTGARPSNSLGAGSISGIVIGSIVVCIILIAFIWKTRRYTRSFLVNAYYNIIWTPRLGEPVWVEGCRLVFRFFILLLLLFFFSYTLWEVLNSSIATITISSSESTIQTPDIRICFDGWTNSSETSANNRPHLICSTDEGYDCMEFITPLNMTLHQPAFSDRLGEVDCFLYAAPKWFGLTDKTGGYGNGTTLIISLYGNNTVTGAIHTTFYPPGMDPNVVYYNITTTDIRQLLTPSQIDSWIVADLDDRYAVNVYSISPKTVVTLGYQIQDHQYLTNSGWNTIGFLPIYNHTPELTTNFRPGVVSSFIQSRGSYHLSNLKVFPNNYATVTLLEERRSTILSVLGSLGGVISLAVAFQMWLFGFRPNSPWGIIQRWSIGPIRRSFEHNLVSRFDSRHTSIPLVDSVYHPKGAFDSDSSQYLNEAKLNFERSSEEEEMIDQRQRLLRVEERMQLTETLLNAYYVNSEIFQKLSESIKQRKLGDSDDTLAVNESEQNLIHERL
ncbi:hypothetical protein J3Q64DRAFT_1770585 [Phycomyces blakesleeanus]|uniref:Galactose oxidase n=1 Tax=Phycomyces blakesleeanus TaxID=4837 RepID=A0ABR3AM47_PHYBL